MSTTYRIIVGKKIMHHRDLSAEIRAHMKKSHYKLFKDEGDGAEEMKAEESMNLQDLDRNLFK